MEFIEKVGKIRKLSNGYSICKAKMHTGYCVEYLWTIWDPSGALYMTCVSYEEASELASSLIKDI